MAEKYEEIRESLEVPKNTGRQGFLRAIEEILTLPRIQDINIDARGKVTYRYSLREGERRREVKPDFDSLLPYAIVRNAEVRELVEPDANAAVAVSQLFDLASADHLFPTAFVAGPDTLFWKWYTESTCIELLSQEEFFGLPVLSDRYVEDYVFILCAAYTRGAPLSDTQRSYKLVIPQVKHET